jgi:hypothetical protein
VSEWAVVRRLLFIAFFAIVTFDVSGLSAICGDAECDESCPGDVSGGECAPNCHFCTCCSLPKVARGATTAFQAPPAEAATWTQSTDCPPSPEPADILHVPKLVLA